MEPFFLIFMYWKITELEKEYASALEEWLDVIGEFEMLNSLANFAYNNRVPTLNTEFKIDFSDLSHPLLNANTRIGNKVCFHPQSFMILTGSNMSGKSTFYVVWE
jgi:DNA mismatch repair ATPase MutS